MLDDIIVSLIMRMRRMEVVAAAALRGNQTLVVVSK